MLEVTGYFGIKSLARFKYLRKWWKIMFDNRIFPFQLNEHRKLSETMTPGDYIKLFSTFTLSGIQTSTESKCVICVWQHRSVHPTKWNRSKRWIQLCAAAASLPNKRTQHARSVIAAVRRHTTTMLYFVLVSHAERWTCAFADQFAFDLILYLLHFAENEPKCNNKT